jgi:uncharacterized membrane protein YkoI
MFKSLTGLGAAAIVAFVIPAFARADDEPIPLDKLPKEVTAAIKKKFPDAELVEADKSKEDGKVVYEVTIKFKKTELDVTVTPEGKILSVEKEIEVADVPKAVMKALEKKYPKATVKGASEISKDDKVAEYEFDIVTKDEKRLYVTFDTAGKFLDEEKVPEEPKKDDKKDKKDDKKDKNDVH